MIKVKYSDSTEEIYDNFTEAEDGILEHHASGVNPEHVVAVDSQGNEGQEYGCTWDVSLEEI
jgi:hypothetical protein